jgi:hypothetical protein
MKIITIIVMKLTLDLIKDLTLKYAAELKMKIVGIVHFNLIQRKIFKD